MRNYFLKDVIPKKDNKRETNRMTKIVTRKEEQIRSPKNNININDSDVKSMACLIILYTSNKLGKSFKL